VALSEGLLKLNWLNGLADLRRAQRSNQELLAAQLEQLYGKPVMTSGEDMIAVESPITHTTNHYAAPPLPEGEHRAGPSVPDWVKAAGLALGLATAVGAGALFGQIFRPGPAASQHEQSDERLERAYALDFWDPAEVVRPAS
jgi:hypothetical protein